MSDLFAHELKVINIGIKSFKETLDQIKTKSIQVDWRSPIDVTYEAIKIIDEHWERIEIANKQAMEIVLKGSPYLIGVDQAINIIPGMKKNLVLHPGPPICWEKMSGPMQGAVIGALVYERMTDNYAEAESLAASEKIEFAPCHKHQTVSPMAGVVTASMPVFMVENRPYGNKAFSTINEGLGKALRYGANVEEVINKLKWIEKLFYPVIKNVLKESGPVDLKKIIAQALQMGDEVHHRNQAATSLFYRTIAPAIVKTGKDSSEVIELFDFINTNDDFFLNLSMAASKATIDAARNIEASSLVVAMTRNGSDFGVQLSGTGNQWYTGKAFTPDGNYFSGYSTEDANLDVGDDSIVETNGLGGLAIASSPALFQLVGGNAQNAISHNREMYEITMAENSVYQIPSLNFRGTPSGIDVIKVIEKGLLPFINTQIVHKRPGIGQIGACIQYAPEEPFKCAFIGLAQELGRLE